jgi:CubicO group peptidase (beta-lactamase class C family)
MTIQRLASLTILATVATCALAADGNRIQDEDERIAKLRNFFLAQRSPLAKHAEVFLGASDKYGLDWRLLPSLAMVETGGLARNNNVFGWGNGRIRFGSIAESIQVIAERLTNALPYRNKTLEGKLRAYNPVNRSYSTHVQGVMNSIGPAIPAPAAAK